MVDYVTVLRCFIFQCDHRRINNRALRFVKIDVISLINRPFLNV